MKVHTFFFRVRPSLTHMLKSIHWVQSYGHFSHFMSADLYRAAAQLAAALVQYSLVLGWSILIIISLIMIYFIEFSKSITHPLTNQHTNRPVSRDAIASKNESKKMTLLQIKVMMMSSWSLV